MANITRIKTVEKLNLSEHTLDINFRKCNYDKFRFSDIEDYVRAVCGDREYPNWYSKMNNDPSEANEILISATVLNTFRNLDACILYKNR